MNITLIGYEGIGGYGSIIYNLGKSLHERGYLHRLICKFSKKENLKINNSMIVEEPIFLRCIHFSLLSTWFFISRRIPERYYNELLFDLFSQRNIPHESDVLLCQSSGFVRSIRKAKEKGIYTIVQQRTAHPKFMYKLLEEETKKFNAMEDSIFMNKSWVKYRDISLKECDKVIAISNIVRDSCIEEGIPEEKIETISTGVGVDTEYFKPHKKENDKFRCLFVGHKTFINGVPYLLEAWKTLNFKDADLIICGRQNKEIIARYKKIINFKVPGTVNPVEYYKNASIFILPSLANAFPKAALEAMSSGLPIIITEGVGTKDIIENGKEGFVVPIKDPDSLAKSIQYFYDNPDEVKRMGKNARKTAEKCTWERYGDEVIEKIGKEGDIKIGKLKVLDGI